jgi:hypothetical protein
MEMYKVISHLLTFLYVEMSCPCERTSNDDLDYAVRRTIQQGGGEAFYGYSHKDCERYRDYVRQFFPGLGIFVHSDHDPQREYLWCTVMVDRRGSKGQSNKSD